MTNVLPMTDGAEFFASCNELQRRWLLAYIADGDPKQASVASRVPYMDAMAWLRDDEKFQIAMDQARTIIGRQLEAFAIGKAKTEEGSDRLMIELLKAFLPERYDPKFEEPLDEDDGPGGFRTKIEVEDDFESREA